jgi:hypothetical protein
MKGMWNGQGIQIVAAVSEERNHLEDLSIDGRTVMKLMRLGLTFLWRGSSVWIVSV